MCAERNVYLLRPPGVPLLAHRELYNNFIAPDAVLLLVGYWPWGWWPSQHKSSFVGLVNVYGILHFGCRWWHPVLSCALKTTTRHGHGVRRVHFGFHRVPNLQTAPT